MLAASPSSSLSWGCDYRAQIQVDYQLEYDNDCSQRNNQINLMVSRRDVAALIPWAFAGLMAGRTGARAAADFQGRKINYIVSTKPGGGYDTMGRLVAKYLEKYLPGSEVRVSNVAGGGHVVGALSIFNAAPDGQTLGTFNTGLIYAQLRGELKEPLDLRKFSWIGKAANEARILVVGASTSFKSVADLKTAGRPIRFVSAGKNTASYFEILMLSTALGFPAQIIPGFEGREAELSIMRGDVDGVMASSSSLEPFVRNGFGRILVEVGGTHADVPQASSLALGDEAQSLISLIETQSKLGRLTAGPPGIDADTLNTLRKAYIDIFSDEGFKAEAGKLNLPIVPMSGAEVAAAIDQALNLPPERLASLRKLLQS